MATRKKQTPPPEQLTTAQLRQYARNMLDKRRNACTCSDPQPTQRHEGAFVVTVCARCDCYTNPS